MVSGNWDQNWNWIVPHLLSLRLQFTVRTFPGPTSHLHLPLDPSFKIQDLRSQIPMDRWRSIPMIRLYRLHPSISVFLLFLLLFIICTVLCCGRRWRRRWRRRERALLSWNKITCISFVGSFSRDNFPHHSINFIYTQKNHSPKKNIP